MYVNSIFESYLNEIKIEESFKFLFLLKLEMVFWCVRIVFKLLKKDFISFL